jgi:hypothetical protein
MDEGMLIMKALFHADSRESALAELERGGQRLFFIFLDKLETTRNLDRVNDTIAPAFGKAGKSMVPLVVKALHDSRVRVRLFSMNAYRYMVESDPAAPEFQAHLPDLAFLIGNREEIPEIRRYAISVARLSVRETGGVLPASFVPALTDALYSSDWILFDSAFKALLQALQEKAIGTLLVALGNRVCYAQEDYFTALIDGLGAEKCEVEVERWKNATPTVAQFGIAVAEKQNTLASKRDILLDGKPKPMAKPEPPKVGKRKKPRAKPLTLL